VVGDVAQTVDIFRDGTFLTSLTGTTVTATASPARGGGSFVYRVCETGTTTCSNDATATF
jgi:hypothetical protein